MLPTPSQLIASFERGEIERDELHAMMALHARDLIREMEEDHQNPAAAWIESLLARRATSSLVRRHSARVLREVLVALADVPDFLPARYLWNAGHPDVPLHCFFRIRRDPVFRILSMEMKSGEIRVMVEYGDPSLGEKVRKSFLVNRDAGWKLRATPI